jgi:RNA polymerase-binding transcription factor DksA
VKEIKSEIQARASGNFNFVNRSMEAHLPATETRQILYRYSDAELEEFRLLITARIETARKELQYLQAQMQGKDDRAENDNRFSIEDGSAAMELEQQGQLAARQVQYINNLENALIRIKNKTYGICRVTGNLIDKARLKAVPHATLSMEAKNK